MWRVSKCASTSSTIKQKQKRNNSSRLTPKIRCKQTVSTPPQILQLLLLLYSDSPYFFFFFHLTYSRWTSLPSCLWSQRIFPSLPVSRLTIFYRDASSALLQLVNQWLNFTYSRSHAFRCCCCCCLHIKNRSDLYPVPFSFLLFKAKKRISVVTR